MAMKTPVATAMAGAQPDKNQQSAKCSNGKGNGSAAAAAAWARQHSGDGGGQLGGRGGSLAEAQIWQQWQRVGKRGDQQLDPATQN